MDAKPLPPATTLQRWHIRGPAASWVIDRISTASSRAHKALKHTMMALNGWTLAIHCSTISKASPVLSPPCSSIGGEQQPWRYTFLLLHGRRATTVKVHFQRPGEPGIYGLLGTLHKGSVLTFSNQLSRKHSDWVTLRVWRIRAIQWTEILTINANSFQALWLTIGMENCLTTCISYTRKQATFTLHLVYS